MQVRSTYRYAKISPFKVREVTRAIQGLPVSAALDLVAFSPKKAAGLIAKTLKRMMTRARGSGSRILKRSAHIRIILTDEIEIKTRDKKKGGKKAGASKKKAQTKGTKAVKETKA